MDSGVLRGLRQPSTFLAVGVLNTGVDVAAFAALTRVLGIPSLAAQVISYAMGTANSYLLNRRVTFRRKGVVATVPEALRFAGTNVGSLAVGSAVLVAAHRELGLTLLMAKGISVAIAAVVNYTGSRLWVFGPRQGRRSSSSDATRSDQGGADDRAIADVPRAGRRHQGRWRWWFVIAELARNEKGGIGPIGQVFLGLAGLIFSLGLVFGISTIGGVIRDQAGYASVINAAAATSARDVNVQALAGGAALVDPTNAQNTFNDYLSLPTEGDLTNNGGGSYSPAGREGSVNAPTVTKVKLGTFTASGAAVAVSGTATDVIPMPIIGTITETLPEDSTITATPSLANIAP